MVTKAQTDRARPPSVERLLSAVRAQLDGPREHDALVGAARSILEEERARLAAEDGVARRELDVLAADFIARLEAWMTPTGAGVRPVINATGVILHTNLGRAPWPQAAIDAAAAAASGYSMLELDAATGRRGARFRIAEEHLVALTGAEDALVTNNNAAALVMAVRLAGRSGVIVSRGELVEIGGGVRIPEIVSRAGGRLIEVGTTNRTRVADYREPLEGGGARLVLRVHPSNFRQAGFVEAPDPIGLAALAHEHGAIVVDDLGSGALLDTAAYGVAHEPTPQESLMAGADLVTFSGDKLLGGPQGGLVVGKADLVAKMRKDPLARAMRPDKVTLAAVAATLGLYRAGRATTDIPVWRMLSWSPDELRARALAIVAALPARAARVGVRVVELSAALGGGSLPGETIPSIGLALKGDSPEQLLARLRECSPPVIGHIQADAVLLDLRTVDPAADASLASAVATAIASSGATSRGTPSRVARERRTGAAGRP
ncbi:MAG TPA: L-seryl-tRNA(Sec) selenium transferase [Candidatus Limnocylindrales bacterium]